MDYNSAAYKLAKRRADEKYKRHSAYKSMYIVAEYDRITGKKSNKKSNLPIDSSGSLNSLDKWRRERWSSVLDYLNGDIVTCGNAGCIHLCRPITRINKSTPITIQELISMHGVKKLRAFTVKAIAAKKKGKRVISWTNMVIS